MPRPLPVLFLCTGNSARSQMAEAWLRAAAEEHGIACAVASAGTDPKGLNPLTIEVMREAGIDISAARSKHLDRFLGDRWDYVITVCDQAQEACPVFPGAAHLLHWSFPDPAVVAGTAAERLAAFRTCRDSIRETTARFVRLLDSRRRAGLRGRSTSSPRAPTSPGH